MRSNRARRPPKTEPDLRLSERVVELEERLRLLEAYVRRTVGARERPRPDTSKRASKPRARCPGCMLELPAGKRKDRCVWCGFCFDALRRRPR
jgi:hypothetical protein